MCANGLNTHHVLLGDNSWRKFIGAFTQLREATGRFIMSVPPFVCPHGTTRLPLGGFSWNLIFEYFSKTCSENPSFIKTGQE